MKKINIIGGIICLAAIFMFTAVPCNAAESSTKAVKVKKVKINKTKLNLKVGKKYKLKVTITPKNATNKKIKWTSNKSKVAKVKNGVVEALTPGTAVISAKVDGKVKKCTVKVKSDTNAFKRKYNTSQIKKEIINYGKSIGMKHISKYPTDWGGGKITPENTTWYPPLETWHYASSTKGAKKMRKDLCDEVKYIKKRGLKSYCLYFEKDKQRKGEYIIYVIII